MAYGIAAHYTLHPFIACANGQLDQRCTQQIYHRLINQLSVYPVAHCR